jgi:hypothetical protein
VGESWDSPQERWDGSTAVAESSTGLQDQYCSSCNQKKPVIEFGRFLTCNMCRQRDIRAKQARKAKHKATYIYPKATNKELERLIQGWSNRGEYKLQLNFRTRPLTIKDYLNTSSS